MPKVTAIILAAGLGSRMGKNKLALPWHDDKTVLETTIERVSKSAVSNGIVVLGYQSEFWKDKLKLPANWQTVINPDYALGQSTSLLKGLSIVDVNDTEAILFCLGDQPLIKTETINTMLEFWQENKCDILIPTYQVVRGNPTIFSKNTLVDMKKLKGDEGARSLFKIYKPDELPVNDRGIIADLDSPEAYEREWRNSSC